MNRIALRHAALCLALAPIATLAASAPAWASEGGTSLYVPGSGGPGNAIMPPFEGVYFDNQVYIYDGEAEVTREMVIGGQVVAGLEATVVADFPTMLWVPSTNFLGGTLAVGASLPLGAPNVEARAILSGPGGAQIGVSREDSAFVLGDPVAVAMLGWKAGNLNIQAGTVVNVPLGNYREGELANLALHRWALDASLGLTWNDPASGWDVSGKAGLTFNGENGITDYYTGTELHLEGSVEKAFSPAFSLGVQGFYLQQISGDSGTGAVLGAFKGSTVGMGVTAATNFMIGTTPTTFRIKVLKEFDVTNRLEGGSVFLNLTFPLSMKIPAQ